MNAIDNGGDTPLDKASAHKHKTPADLLRKHGGKRAEELKTDIEAKKKANE